MISVRIRVWALEVEIQSTESHPDHLTDLVNRASRTFAEALASLEAEDLPIYDPELADPDEED